MHLPKKALYPNVHTFLAVCLAATKVVSRTIASWNERTDERTVAKSTVKLVSPNTDGKYATDSMITVTWCQTARNPFIRSQTKADNATQNANDRRPSPSSAADRAAANWRLARTSGGRGERGRKEQVFWNKPHPSLDRAEHSVTIQQKRHNGSHKMIPPIAQYLVNIPANRCICHRHWVKVERRVKRCSWMQG